MKSRLAKSLIAGIALSLSASAANAALIFSDVSVTSRSLSFTVDGDLSGYVPDPGTNLRQFSILFSGDFWLGALGSYSRNTWSTSLFDNVGISYVGNTGWFFGATTPYTWVSMTQNLTNAVATNRSVTVDFGSDFIDPSAAGNIEFFWGNGYTTSNKTSIQLTSSDPLPAPSSVVLIGLALATLGGVAGRKSRPAKA